MRTAPATPPADPTKQHASRIASPPSGFRADTARRAWRASGPSASRVLALNMSPISWRLSYSGSRPRTTARPAVDRAHEDLSRLSPADGISVPGRERLLEGGDDGVL